MHIRKRLVISIIAAFIVGGLFGVTMFYTEPYILTRGGSSPEDRVSTLLAADVSYVDGTYGYLVEPTGSGERPALILIHDEWGLDEDMRSLARQFAKEGYVALAIDLYDGETTEDPVRASELSTEARSDPAGVLRDLAGAVQYLRSKENIDPSRIAAVGWGTGGHWAYQMALHDLGTHASVVYYGEFGPLDEVLQINSPVLGHFAELDTRVRIETVRGLEARLREGGGAYEIYTYPSVDHGFAQDRGGTNARYNKEASLLAWNRTVEFLVHALEKSGSD